MLISNKLMQSTGKRFRTIINVLVERSRNSISNEAWSSHQFCKGFGSSWMLHFVTGWVQCSAFICRI